jgi:TrpR-related protein YerC/YecD
MEEWKKINYLKLFETNMAKVKSNSFDPKEKYKIIGEFFEIISGLKSKKEIIDFFVGLLTPSEAIMMARRIQVAKMVIEGNGYDEIMKKMKVSSQTITKTEHWLHGKGEEYAIWITSHFKELNKALDNESKKRKGVSNYIYSSSVLDKYPNYRLWKELLG